MKIIPTPYICNKNAKEGRNAINQNAVSTSRITKIIIFRPKSVKNYLNNSQNHVQSVNGMLVILQLYILPRHPKLKLPKIIAGRLYVGNLLPNCQLKQ